MPSVVRIPAALLVLLLEACHSAALQANDVTVGTGAVQGGNREHGRDLFATNCSTCHGPLGAGGAHAFSLRDEHLRMDYGTLVSWIEDPEPPMPHLYPQVLKEKDVRDIAAYVEAL